MDLCYPFLGLLLSCLWAEQNTQQILARSKWHLRVKVPQVSTVWPWQEQEVPPPNTVCSRCASSRQSWRKRSLRSSWWRLASSTRITTRLRGQPKWCSTTSTHAMDLRTGSLGCTGFTAPMRRSVGAGETLQNSPSKVGRPKLNGWLFFSFFYFQDVDNSSRNYQLEVEAQEIISNVSVGFYCN